MTRSNSNSDADADTDDDFTQTLDDGTLELQSDDSDDAWIRTDNPVSIDR